MGHARAAALALAAVVALALVALPSLSAGDPPRSPASGGHGSATPSGVPSQPPTASPGRALPLDGMVVVLDPGHNRDNGAFPQTRDLVDAGGFLKECNSTGTVAADGYPESRFNWEVADDLAAALMASGARVVLTRDGDEGWGPCIDERGRIASEHGADLMLSLHADGSDAPGDTGFHVIAQGALTGWTDDTAAASAHLAVSVRDALVAAGFMPSNYRGRDGVDERNDLGTLNWADVPAVLVETHNMRDVAESRQLRTPEGRGRLVAALAEAVVTFARTDGET